MIGLKKSPVVFNEENHTYHLGELELQGVTSTLVRRAFPNKYSDVPEEVLAEAARKGTELHQEIEFRDRFGGDMEDVRLKNYFAWKDSNNLCTLENEYTVSDEQHYASQIDVVLANDKDEICLADIKTTYNLDRASVALQLSIYKRFFEMQNPALKVSHIYAIWLPNRDETIAEMPELTLVDDETLDALIKADLADEPFVFSPIPQEYEEMETQYRHWAAIQEEAENNLKAIKDHLMQMMVEKNLQQIKSGYYTVSYIPAKVSKKFDSAAFKKENKELYDSYMKESETAASIRFLPTKK